MMLDFHLNIMPRDNLEVIYLFYDEKDEEIIDML